MKERLARRLTFLSNDQREIVAYKWNQLTQPAKGVVQIAHGMAETASRYEHFAKALNENGWIVYANDHRGHGESADSKEQLGYLGETKGFERLVSDMDMLTTIIRNENPTLPIYLFGHSMGSFASQRYLMDYHNRIDGVILSGSNGEQGLLTLNAGQLLAQLEMSIRGKKAKSRLMNQLIFGRYNRLFKPKRTGFKWLSRDKHEVDKYVQNPYAGGIFPTSFYVYLINNLKYIENQKNFYKIPKNIPIFIISGSDDPVGDYGKGVKKLYQRYKQLLVKSVEMKIYHQARHELLNETNKDEVIVDIINWLNQQQLV
ncbi:alpha/beta hydrolase [Atopobacter phocae]|uniref:alpha/beta hydrolase n=1 Tax=Atopobacter phocae TaxID=136492 RepID=UPI000472AA74|nr:alpha/beta hydrolase [Atopobacter phocae]